MNNLPFSRKQITITSVIILSIIIVTSIISYYFSFQDITVEYDKSKYSSVILYKGTDSSSEKTIIPTSDISEKSIESGKNYRLKKGNYYLVATGENVKAERIGIILSGQKRNISLDYSYSNEYLSKLTDSERKNIDNTIFSSNNKIASFYDIKSEQVIGDGNWAIAALVFKGSETDLNRDTLKAILQKKNDKWSLSCKIAISISKYECNSVPQLYLERANTIDISTQTPLMPRYNLDRKPGSGTPLGE